jgi:hypothetical protein
VYRAYRDFQALRLHFLAQRQPYSYTCMIKEMPAEDANDEALTKLFNFTTNGNVDYAAVGRNVCIRQGISWARWNASSLRPALPSFSWLWVTYGLLCKCIQKKRKERKG